MIEIVERKRRKTQWLTRAERRAAIICGTVYILKSNIKKRRRAQKAQKGTESVERHRKRRKAQKAQKEKFRNVLLRFCGIYIYQIYLHYRYFVWQN